MDPHLKKNENEQKVWACKMEEKWKKIKESWKEVEKKVEQKLGTSSAITWDYFGEDISIPSNPKSFQVAWW